MKHLLTIDVEEWYEGLPIAADRKSTYAPALERPMHRLLDMLDEHSAKATFFWLSSCAARYPTILREVTSRGHEIACHGLSHDAVYDMSPARFSEETREARKTIEDVAGTAVEGYRAAYFSVTGKSLWALDILAEQGFRFDSSIAPIHYWRYGIPSFPREIRAYTTAGGSIIEYPISVHRVAGVNFPFAGGGFFRLLPYSVVKHCFDRAPSPVVFYLHPWELDDQHPVVPVASTVQLSHYMNLRKTESKLQRLLQDFRFTSIVRYNPQLMTEAGCAV
jgi:polysaccharide deacetylase family protein (PEP-CTERM system associated)